MFNSYIVYGRNGRISIDNKHKLWGLKWLKKKKIEEENNNSINKVKKELTLTTNINYVTIRTKMIKIKFEEQYDSSINKIKKCNLYFSRLFHTFFFLHTSLISTCLSPITTSHWHTLQPTTMSKPPPTVLNEENKSITNRWSDMILRSKFLSNKGWIDTLRLLEIAPPLHCRQYCNLHAAQREREWVSVGSNKKKKKILLSYSARQIWINTVVSMQFTQLQTSPMWTFFFFF